MKVSAVTDRFANVGGGWEIRVGKQLEWAVVEYSYADLGCDEPASWDIPKIQRDPQAHRSTP